MKNWAVALTFCIALGAVFAFAQGTDEGYQTAQVVSFEKVPANEQHPENADRYKVAMRMNGAVYLCQASGPISTFMGWAPNKEFPAKLDEKNKLMLVKSPNGQVVELKIQKKKQ
jgi:hypothetical protein